MEVLTNLRRVLLDLPQQQQLGVTIVLGIQAREQILVQQLQPQQPLPGEVLLLQLELPRRADHTILQEVLIQDSRTLQAEHLQEVLILIPTGGVARVQELIHQLAVALVEAQVVVLHVHHHHLPEVQVRTVALDHRAVIARHVLPPDRQVIAHRVLHLVQVPDQVLRPDLHPHVRLDDNGERRF